MPSTRRGFLLGSAALPLLSGCSQFGSPSTTVVEVEVVLVNGQDEPLTFHFAFETVEGLGGWSSHEVGPVERKSVTVDPSEHPEFVAIHAVVAGHATSAELLDYGPDAGEVCPGIYVEYELADAPTILQDANIGC